MRSFRKPQDDIGVELAVRKYWQAILHPESVVRKFWQAILYQKKLAGKYRQANLLQRYSATVEILVIKHQFHWAMIAAKDLVMDFCTYESLAQAVGDDKVVNTPSCVLLTGQEAVGPPRVLDFIGV